MISFGFIMLRHVNNELTNQYWIHSYECIRKHYPENSIIIVDDNSIYNFITDKKLYKTTIINSEYPQRGELLPYYYYLHHKLFDIAVIIHDSVFINKYVDIMHHMTANMTTDISIHQYKLIWEFEHHWDQIEDESRMIHAFNDLELTEFYKNKHLWKGCFGAMSIITHDYLTYINNKYDISKLLDFVVNRHNRCSFERVIACLLQRHAENKSLLGNIHSYGPYGITFNEKDNYTYLPFTKCWSGR